ncbi:hypothetical protein MP638_000774 [Amoeboaphelidium occidentale]|nr:hypothetical protein MP638_000774 [Amoeboaphelidium occidentale]
MEWSVAEVSEWLHSNNLGKFEGNFTEHDITGRVLFDLDHALLKEMGIISVGDRISVLSAIQKLKDKDKIITTVPESFLFCSPSPTSSLARSPRHAPVQSPRASKYQRTGSHILAKGTVDTVEKKGYRAESLPAKLNFASSVKPRRAQLPHIVTHHTATPDASFVTDLDERSPCLSERSFSPFSFIESFVKGFKKATATSPTEDSPKEDRQDIMRYETVLERCIKVTDEEKQVSFIINVAELNTPEEILERIYKKFKIGFSNESHYALFAKLDQEGDFVCLNDKQILHVCKAYPHHPCKDKLLLRRMQRSQLEPPKTDFIISGDLRRSTFARNKALVDRPSSDLISSNLDLFFTEQATKESLPASVRSSLYLRSRAASMKSQATKVEEIPSEDETNNKDSEIARLGNYSDKFDYDLYERLYDLLHLDDDLGNKGRFMHNWIKGDLIGKGSFANVYYGYDPETEIIMAVKQVDLPASSSFLNDRRSKMLTSLTREIEFLKTLRHENVVGYLGSCCDGLTLNVFLEYVGGGSIASLIQKQGWISLDDTKVYVKQILGGLSYLHGLKIIHRDIKGGNVLVTEDKKCKISDFGVATLMDSVISKRHSVQGSVFWMSPEMVKRTSCTTKVDVWSLGCLVLEMLTGERPWYGFDQIQALYQIGMGLKNPIDHLNEVWQENSGTSFTSSLPQTALEFLQAMFKADPEERASADLLLDSEFLKIV